MKKLMNLIIFIILIIIGLTYYNNMKDDDIPKDVKIERTTDDVKDIADDARDGTKKVIKNLKEWWND